MMELDKQRLEKEEEERKMYIEIEEKLKAFEHECLCKFDSCANHVDLFGKTY